MLRPSLIYKGKRQYIALILIFLLGFYFRIEPYLIAPGIPYGMRDGAHHYQIAQRIYEKKPLDYIHNSITYRDGRLTLPPLTHYILGYISRITGEPNHTIFILNSFIAACAILTTYLLIREILDVPAALISAIFMAFSARDIMAVSWGQWPAVYAFSLSPLVIYLGIRSLKDPKTLMIFSFFSAITFNLHPQLAIYPISCALTFGIISYGKARFSKNQILSSILIFVIFATPMLIRINSLLDDFKEESKPRGGFIEIMLSWYPMDQAHINYPASWYDPLANFNIFGLILAFFGSILYFWKKNDQKINSAFRLFTIILVMYYLAIHLSQLWSISRAVRYMLFESLIFTLAASLVFSEKINIHARFRALGVGLIICFLVMQFAVVYGVGERLFPPQKRLSPLQLESLIWIKENTPENSSIIYNGFMMMMPDWGTTMSGRRILEIDKGILYFQKQPVKPTKDIYLLFDGNLPLSEPHIMERQKGQIEDMLRLFENSTDNAFENQEIMIRRLRFE